METILHKAVRYEYNSGLLEPNQYVNAYKKANELTDFDFGPVEPGYSPRAHEKRFEDVAEYLSKHLPIIRTCNDYETIEIPRWHLGKALLDIRPEDGYCPLSQLEAVIVWMSLAQKQNLPIKHYINNNGNRIIVWDSGTIRYNAHAISGALTTRYDSKNHHPHGPETSAYLFEYYKAILLYRQNKERQAKRLILDRLTDKIIIDSRDPYFMNLTALLYILNTGYMEQNPYRKIVELLEESMRLVPSLSTANLIVEILMMNDQSDLAIKWLRRIIENRVIGREEKELYNLLSGVYDKTGNQEMASAILEEFKLKYRRPF